MRERKEVLDYGLTLPDTYIDTPFHDDNWVLLRYRKNKRAFAWTYERNGQIWVNVKVDPQWRCRGIIRTKNTGIPLSWTAVSRTRRSGG